MQIEVEIWSDNHGKDETFGTKPNEPHKVCLVVVNGDDLIEAVLRAVRSVLLSSTPCEKIHVIGGGNDVLGREVLRMRIAESEFVCAAKVVL